MAENIRKIYRTEKLASGEVEISFKKRTFGGEVENKVKLGESVARLVKSDKVFADYFRKLLEG